jgi:hypothetical protein
MNPQGTSFIPNRPTQGNLKNRGVRKVYILTYISYVVFFGTLLAVGGVFAYKFTLNAQLTRQQQLLADERSRFKQADIESVKELERRINTSKERMDKHLSVLSVFESFEKAAVQSLRFASLTYARKTDEGPEVTITGDSDTFNSVLFQRDVLLANPVLANATVSGVVLGTVSPEDEEGKSKKSDEKKTISFSIKDKIDTSLIPYVPRIPVSSDAENLDTVDEQDETVTPTNP